MPIVSVVMPAYNCGGYVRESIDTLIAQTLSDFELIVIDDGSTDNTSMVLDSIDDDRIRAVRQPNGGTATALNLGLSLTTADLVAIAHGDDLNHPSRLERQVAFLHGHPKVTALGTRFRSFTPDGHTHAEPLLAMDRDIRREMYLRCPFGHPTMMLRRAAVLAAGGYRQQYWPAEDYDLWRRMPGKLANLVETLVEYRVHPQSTSRVAGYDMGLRIQAEMAATGRPALLPSASGWWRHRREPRYYAGRILAAQRRRRDPDSAVTRER